MNREEIIKAINEVPAGRFFRMSYTSELPVKASVKKQGVTVMKLVETTVRTGVSYDKISAVIEYRATHEPKVTTPRANNWEWVTKNRIKYNSNTGKTYAVVAPIKSGGNARCKYIIIDQNGQRVVDPSDLDRSLVIDSYWSRGDGVDAIRTIALEHILGIGI